MIPHSTAPQPIRPTSTPHLSTFPISLLPTDPISPHFPHTPPPHTPHSLPDSNATSPHTSHIPSYPLPFPHSVYPTAHYPRPSATSISP